MKEPKEEGSLENFFAEICREMRALTPVGTDVWGFVIVQSSTGGIAIHSMATDRAYQLGTIDRAYRILDEEERCQLRDRRPAMLKANAEADLRVMDTKGMKQ